MRRTECILTAMLLCLCLTMRAERRAATDTLVIGRMLDYAQKIDTTEITNKTTYAYIKTKFDIQRRNIFLLPVPTMYRVAHGPRRKYINESYYKLEHDKNGSAEPVLIAFLSTVPHNTNTLPTVRKFLRPNIYAETIIEDYLLSPFNRENKIFYRYNVIYLPHGKANISFNPRNDNTQLVKGSVIVDTLSGRIISGYMNGEYDMISFNLTFNMNEEGASSLFPKSCELNARFDFIGNKIAARYSANYDLNTVLPDTVVNKEDSLMIKQVRTKPLRTEEMAVYNEFYNDTTLISTHKAKKQSNWLKRLFWDSIGEHLLQKTTGNYGTNDQGYIRLNPLFNPLYMGYSDKKGYYYKFDIRTSFTFNENSFIFARFKAGYSFKQDQFYFKVPVEYHYNRHRHGYVQLLVGNGNWIKNDHARQNAINNLPTGTTDYNYERMEFFKDFYLQLLNNYDISDKLSFQVGLVEHRRVAVERRTYRDAHVRSAFTSVAPMIEASIRPMGWKGPILNLSWERSMHGFMNADIAYERWEADLQYIKRLTRLRSLSFRAGSGLYTLVGGENYFLDYTNFRDNNLPNGWNDEWTGEFELLPSDEYNLSRYYVRSNVTYESPLLLLSWVPILGHFVEKERIYGSALLASRLHPYTEIGYGFTTRWVSVGIFSAFREGKYDGVGIKVGLELFRQW